MDTLLAILMVLGIFVGIPAVIGFSIVGIYVLSDRRAMRAERAKALEEAFTDHAKARGKVIAKEFTKE